MVMSNSEDNFGSMVRFGSGWWRVSAVTDSTDLHAVFESSMYDFDLCEDGSWRAWQDGHVVASGAFSRHDLWKLSDTAYGLHENKIGLFANDRTGEQ